MRGLSIQLLGPFYVTLDEQPVNTFGYDKVRALLVYLAVEQERPHRREALAGLLWPDQAEEAAQCSLRNALSRLRRVIGDVQADPPYLIVLREQIQFNPDCSAWLDVHRFNQLLEATHHHGHRRIEACPTCTAHLIEATNLYHGDFLEGFNLPDSEPFSDWLRIQRDVLHQLAIEALDKLASTYEWRGEPEKALTYTQKQLSLDVYREEAYVRWMKLAAGMGKRAQACEQYERCKLLLNQELGLEPMQETTHLYEQIKYGLYQPQSRHPLRTNNLPANLTSFVGRERELDEIRALLAEPDCRLLTLVGPGGVGKTRLAIAAASQQHEIFPNGVCLVSLAGVASTEGIIPAILQALDLKPASDPKKSLLDYLRDKEMVILLDNFEHLLKGTEIVSELLQAAPGIFVLVTSRQRLGLQAEWLFEVSGLIYPSTKESHNLASFEAVKLFTQRLHQVKPRQTVFEDDLLQVSRICRVVEGFPLGIELAASAVKQKSIDQVASAIESGKEDLRTSLKDIPERHRSIRAVFEHSYKLLNPGEQAAFTGLGVFRAAFTADAADQVAGASSEIMLSLVEHSLVRYDANRGQYFMHELVRQYALDRLKRSSEMMNEVEPRYIRYFMQELIREKEMLWGREQNIAMKKLDQQLLDFRAAWKLAFERPIFPELFYSTETLCTYYLYCARFSEGIIDCNFALEAINNFQKLDSQYLHLKIHLQSYLSVFLYRSGKITVIVLMQMLHGCLAVLDGPQCAGTDFLGDKSWILRIMSEYIGKVDNALQFASESLLLSRQSGDKHLQAEALGMLARMSFYLGEFIKAERYCEEALSIWRLLGDPRSLAEQLQNMSQIYGLIGKTQKCLQIAHERCELLLSLGDHVSIAESLRGFAVCLELGNRWVDADKVQSDSLPYIRDLGDQVKLCNTYANWSRVKLYLGQYDTATKMARDNNTLARQIDYKYALAKNYIILGQVALVRGQLNQSIEYLDTAARVCNQAKLSFMSGDALSSLSIAKYQLGLNYEGTQRMLEGLKIGVETHNFIILSENIQAAGLYLAMSGNIERGVELYGLIYHKAWSGNTVWVTDVIGNPIMVLAADLPSEVVTAAIERGRKLDLFETAALLLKEFQVLDEQMT